VNYFVEIICILRILLIHLKNFKPYLDGEVKKPSQATFLFKVRMHFYWLDAMLSKNTEQVFAFLDWIQVLNPDPHLPPSALPFHYSLTDIPPGCPSQQIYTAHIQVIYLLAAPHNRYTQLIYR
jgi:hypothetical protein